MARAEKRYFNFNSAKKPTSGIAKTGLLKRPIGAGIIAYDDSQASAGVFRTGVSSLTLDTLVGGIMQYRFDVNDEPHIPAIQFSHSIQIDSTINPHLHLINKNAIGASPLNIRFEFEYALVNIDGQILATVNDPQEFDIGGLLALTHFIVKFTDIIPAGDQGGISSAFICRLKRIAALSDPYNTNDIFTFGFDLHYLKDSVGSTQEYIK